MSQSGFTVGNNDEYTPSETSSISSYNRNFNLNTPAAQIKFNDIVDIEEYNFDDIFETPDDSQLTSLIRSIEDQISRIEEEYQELSFQIKKNPTDTASKLSMLSNQKKELEERLAILKNYDNLYNKTDLTNLMVQSYNHILSDLETERQELLTEMKINPSQQISDRLIEINNEIDFYNKQLNSINNAINKIKEYQAEINAIISMSEGNYNNLDADNLKRIEELTEKIVDLNSLVQILKANESTIIAYQEIIEDLENQAKEIIPRSRNEVSEKNDILNEIQTYKQIVLQLKANLDIEDEIIEELSKGNDYFDVISKKFEKYIIEDEDKAATYYTLLISELMIEIQKDPTNEDLINKYNELTNPKIIYQQYLEYVFAELNPSIPHFENNAFGLENNCKKRIINLSHILNFDAEEIYQKEMEYLEAQQPEWWEQLLAGQAKAFTAVGGGIAKGGEFLLDTATLICGGLAMIGTSIFDLATGQFGNPNSATYAVQNVTTDAIGIDRVAFCEESLIQYDEVFKWIENKSPNLWKQDGFVKNLVEGLSELAFQIALGNEFDAAASIATGSGMLLSNELTAATNASKGFGIILAAGLRGFGDGTERAIQGGADLSQATSYGALSASWEMAQWTIGQKLEFIKELGAAKGASKAQKYIAYMGYIFANGVDAGVESFFQPLLQLSYSDKNYWELYEANGGNAGLGMQFAFGTILSALSVGLDIKNSEKPKELALSVDRYYNIKEYYIKTDQLDKLDILTSAYKTGKIDSHIEFEIITEYLENVDYLQKNPCFRRLLDDLEYAFKNGNSELALKEIELLCNNYDKIQFTPAFTNGGCRANTSILVLYGDGFKTNSYHEYGHYIHFQIQTQDGKRYLPENYLTKLKTAQQNGIDNSELLIKFYNKIEETKIIDYNSGLELYNNDIIKEYGSIQNYIDDIYNNLIDIKDSYDISGMVDYALQGLDYPPATLNKFRAALLNDDYTNPETLHRLAEYVYINRRENFANSFRIYNSEESMACDIVSSIFQGEPVSLDGTSYYFHGHSSSYFKNTSQDEAGFPSFTEIVANINALKLSGREDLISDLKEIFGPEIIEEAERIIEGAY